jgi:hypothetical protein
MNIYTIYRATNIINGKVYIGFDSHWPNRMKKHQYSSKRGDSKFYRAIRKHGWANFTWEVVYQSLEYEHTLRTMENHFIVEYNSKDAGYNMTTGGDGTKGFKHSTEEKKLRSVRSSNVAKIQKSNNQLGFQLGYAAAAGSIGGKIGGAISGKLNTGSIGVIRKDGSGVRISLLDFHQYRDDMLRQQIPMCDWEFVGVRAKEAQIRKSKAR